MFSFSVEGKDEKLTIDIRPVEVKLDSALAAAITKFLNAAASFLDWIRRAEPRP